MRAIEYAGYGFLGLLLTLIFPALAAVAIIGFCIWYAIEANSQ